MTHQPRQSFTSPRFAHPATFMRLPHVEDPHGLDVAIVGVPFDGGTSYRPGARLGPREVRAGGRRYYRSEDVRTVETIDRLVHREGYTLKGAKRTMLEGTAKPAKALPPAAAPIASPALTAAVATNFAYRARLIALRTTLVNALHDA